jgi:NitT/TauT family transport system substrate-binding protein
MTHKTSRLLGYLLAVGVMAAASVPAYAADKLKVAISQRGFWNSSIAYFAIERGFTKNENLDVEYIFTSGGAETLQTVTTRATDIAISTGFLGVLGAYEKGAPLRIWAQEGHGTPELFHYVRADSPIKSRKDYPGRKIAFSRPGSTTNLFAIKVTQGLNPPATLVSTGGVPATRTQVMTGQVDVGWSVPPFNLDLVRKGEARIVLRGSDMPELNQQSIRVHVVHADVLKNNRDAVRRFAKAFNDALTWMYDKPEESAQAFAGFAKISVQDAKESIPFFPRPGLELAPVIGIDETMKEAVAAKFIKEPLTKAQLDELIQIVYDPKKK